jgi:predicted porin
MEEAAAEEAAADALEEAELSSSSSNGCGHSGCGSAVCAGDAGAHADQQQRSKQQTKQQKKQEAFSVGATADLDASYVASQRLLMMAGVKLRQHTLQRSIHLGQHGSSSR